MNLINTLQIPTSKLDLFIRSVEISSYLPGRVRLRSSKLISNPALEVEVQAQLGAFPEIASTETSTVTGSIRCPAQERGTPQGRGIYHDARKEEMTRCCMYLVS